MTTFLSDGVDWLADVLDAQTGQPLTYSRGATSATITGCVGSSQFETDSEFGVLRIESRDFLITASRLSAFGEPARGDKITETQGSDSVTHEVLNVQGIPPFSYCDNSRKRYRIHTKRITTA